MPLVEGPPDVVFKPDEVSAAEDSSFAVRNYESPLASKILLEERSASRFRKECADMNLLGVRNKNVWFGCGWK